MNENEYIELSCRSIGNDCNFMIRAATEEEVLRLSHGHLCEVHDVCALTSELKDRISGSIKSKACEDGVCSL